MRPKLVKKILIILKPALLLVVILTADAAAAAVDRTSLRVQNLTCSACLTRIAAGLKAVVGVKGMRADLEQGLLAVDHETAVPAEKIAATITALGYPAQIILSAPTAPATASAFQNSGGGCCPNDAAGPCRAASASWRELFRRYFGKKNRAAVDKDIKD